jgi:predicted phage gp36 major capsid-like protein
MLETLWIILVIIGGVVMIVVDVRTMLNNRFKEMKSHVDVLHREQMKEIENLQSELRDLHADLERMWRKEPLPMPYQELVKDLEDRLRKID